MTTPLDGSYSLTASFNTPSWTTRNSSAQTNEGSIQLTWSGANTTDSTAVIEGSDDGTNWNVLARNDGTSNAITLSAAAGSQIWELAGVRVTYVRLTYAHGSNSAGTGVIVTYSISRD